MITMTWWQIVILLVITDVVIDVLFLFVIRPLIRTLRNHRYYAQHYEYEDCEDF